MTSYKTCGSTPHLRTSETLRPWRSSHSRGGPAEAPEGDPFGILALRKIVINLLYGEKAGEPLSEERVCELTAGLMRRA
jgi:hypothetical protein